AVVANRLPVPAALEQTGGPQPTDGMVIDQHVRTSRRELLIRPQRLHLIVKQRIDHLGVDGGLMALKSEPAKHAEHVIRNGIVGCQRGCDEMNAAHAYCCPTRAPTHADSHALLGARRRKSGHLGSKVLRAASKTCSTGN